jgi:hypothetical protein
LADPELEAVLTRDGIVGPFPVLDRSQVEHLRARLEPLVPSSSGFFAMLRPEDDPEVRREIAAVLREELADTVSSLLTGHRLLAGCGIFVKHPGEDSNLGIHQDWTFVDEARFRTGSVWIPLVDVGPHNGRLHAVLGSHEIGPTLRGSPLWPYPTEHVADELVDRYLTPFDVPAGHALVYDHRVVHGSFANLSSSPRMAVVLGWVTEGADLHHYYLDEDGRQTRFTVTDDFFLNLVIGPYPTCDGIVAAEEVDLPIVQLQPEDLERFQPTSNGSGAASGSAPADAPQPTSLQQQQSAPPVAGSARTTPWYRRLRRHRR